MNYENLDFQQVAPIVETMENTIMINKMTKEQIYKILSEFLNKHDGKDLNVCINLNPPLDVDILDVDIANLNISSDSLVFSDIGEIEIKELTNFIIYRTESNVDSLIAIPYTQVEDIKNIRNNEVTDLLRVTLRNNLIITLGFDL